MKRFLIIVMMCYWYNNLHAQKTTKTIQELKKEYLIKAYKTQEYKKAFIDVHEINEYIKLANQGLLKKDDVVQKYNSQLGGYMGTRKTFKGVSETMKEKGDSFIHFILLKSAGRLALEDAAETSN